MERPTGSEHQATPESDEPVPVFGSWARIYTAVVVSALVVMLFIALFTAWGF